MESNTPSTPTVHTIHQTKPTPPKRSLFSLIKKYFWHIVVFLIIATTSGVLLADHEAKSTTTWETYTSKDAGLSFKHPRTFKVIEDQGWRITVYTSAQNTENNIKILYSHQDSSAPSESAEEQFLANCQAAKVSEIDANGTRIKVYEDSTCGAQKVENSILVYSENGMTYDIGLFGKTDRQQLYTFLSTFQFAKQSQSTTPSLADIQIANWKTYTNEKYGYTLQYPADYAVEPFIQTPEEYPFPKTPSEGIFIRKGDTSMVISVEFLDTTTQELTLNEFVQTQGPAINRCYEDKPAKIETVTTNSGLQGIKAWYWIREGCQGARERGLNKPDILFDYRPKANALIQIYVGNMGKIADNIIASFTLLKPSPTLTLPEGQMCGGIAAIQCPSGFVCRLDGDHPDAGGTCEKETKPARPGVSTAPEEVTMCTMDAKQCSDGSFVGRTGPNCEFVCPDGSVSR